jgi:hypothetical protein
LITGNLTQHFTTDANNQCKDSSKIIFTLKEKNKTKQNKILKKNNESIILAFKLILETFKKYKNIFLILLFK